MLLLTLTQVRARVDARNPHLAHVPLHRFAIDEFPFTPQLDSNAA
jgi:hypothetical protein